MSPRSMLTSLAGSLFSRFRPSTSITDDTKVDFRRASTILQFIQATCQQLTAVALSEEESVSVKAMVAALLPIGFVSAQDAQVEGLQDLAQASQDALDAVIRILSVPAFAASVEPLLAGDNVQVRRLPQTLALGPAQG